MTEKNARTNETQKRQQQLWCGSSSLVLFKLSYSIILIVSLSLKNLKFPTSETAFGCCFSLNFKQVTVVRDPTEFKAKYPLYEAVNRCARGQCWLPDSLFYFLDKKEVCEQLQNECDTSDQAIHHSNQYWLCTSYL